MTEDEGRAVVRAVATVAEIGPVVVDYDSRFTDSQIHGMTVFTDPPRIWLCPSLLDEPDELLSTAIHEVAHILAGENAHGPEFVEQIAPLIVRLQIQGVIA